MTNLLRRAGLWLWAWFDRTAKDPRKKLAIDLLNFAGLLALGIVFVFYAAGTHDALCNLRGDIQQRADRAQQFLNDNPNLKTLKFGQITVTRDDLKNQLKRQRSTLHALNGLNC